MADEYRGIEINVTTDAGKAQQQLADTIKRVRELKEQQRELAKQRKEGSISEEQFAEALARNRVELAEATKAEKQATQIAKLASGQRSEDNRSIREQQTALSVLKNQWYELGKQQRESAAGVELKRHIDELTETVKAAEYSVGDFQRNVGNYPSAFDASEEALTRFAGIISKVFGSGSIVDKTTRTIIGFGKHISDASKEVKDSADTIASASANVDGYGSTAGKASEAVGDMAKATATAGNNAEQARTKVGGFGAKMSDTATGAKMATTAVGGLTGGVKALGKQLLQLLANPIVAIIAAVAVGVMAAVKAFSRLKDAIKSSDDAGTALDKLLAVLKVPLKLIGSLIDALGHALTPVIEGLASFAGWVARLIPSVGELAEREMELVAAQDALEESERLHAVASAKREAQIAELQTKSRESQKYTLDERRKFLQEALKLEQQDLDELQKINKQRLTNYANEISNSKTIKGVNRERVALLVALGELNEQDKARLAQLASGYKSLTKAERDELKVLQQRASIMGALTDDQKKQLSELLVAQEQAVTNYNNGIRRATTQLNNFDKEAQAERKARAEEARRQAEEARRQAEEAVKTTLELRRKLADEQLKSIGEQNAREVALLRQQTAVSIANLKERLTKEKNLTAEARKYLNALIQMQEVSLNKALEVKAQQHLDKVKALYATNEELKVALMSEGFNKQLALAELNVRKQEEAMQMLTDTYQNNIDELDRALKRGLISINDYKEEVARLSEVYEVESTNAILRVRQAQQRADKVQSDETKRQFDERIKALTKAYADELNAGKLRADEKVKILRNEQRAIKMELDALQQFTEDEVLSQFGTIDNWKDALISLTDTYKAVSKSAEVEMANASKAVADAQKSALQGGQAMLASFGELFGNLAEQDKRYQDFATAIALAQILTNTATSISEAISGATAAAAAGGPTAPFLLAGYIASMVGSVVSAIAGATSTLEQARQAKDTATFSEGGFVQGAGTATSDSINARLSNGESVLTARATAEHYDELSRWNVEGGGRAFPNANNLTHFAKGGVVGGVNYLQMRQAMIDAVSDIQPVVSVKEITRVANRVAVKERIITNN